MFKDRYIDMFKMFKDRYIDMFKLFKERYIDMGRHAHRHANTHAYRRAYRHIEHMCRVCVLRCQAVIQQRQSAANNCVQHTCT